MQNRLILCVGFRGSGKSTVASSILRANEGAFIFDPHGDDAYRWVPNTARTMEHLHDYSRWRRETKFLLKNFGDMSSEEAKNKTKEIRQRIEVARSVFRWIARQIHHGKGGRKPSIDFSKKNRIIRLISYMLSQGESLEECYRTVEERDLAKQHTARRIWESYIESQTSNARPQNTKSATR